MVGEDHAGSSLWNDVRPKIGEITSHGNKWTTFATNGSTLNYVPWNLQSQSENLATSIETNKLDQLPQLHCQNHLTQSNLCQRYNNETNEHEKGKCFLCFL